ncbi:glucose 1-dehydrogenase [Pseudomonas flexibilis]|uniref:Short-chain dehydrogenase n=1 Tax=Pseudomonas flexibilis TaxID=706570 RepID=A0A0B3BUB8_9PSED|nr:glucose 1-dehydrogenase [Pseudomonas flexibilis]KHO64274.1 short-chain dehydrogenase [Pseudomonas flexibilis]SCY12926.1 7-alpha-hydroxysteroid dehydrogenase [Pseudomonas flexibilis]
MSLLDRFTLHDSVAIVTGAGRGIGRAIALAYAEAGARVVCAARTRADVEAVAAEICAAGGEAIAVRCDVNDDGMRRATVAAALEAFGRITHLVNNAGGAGPNDPLRMSVEEFEQVLRFNVGSAYALTQLCVPHMRQAGAGNVLNITSGAARYAQPQFSAYGAAKAALTQLTRLLAHDFAPTVRVNAIAPGPILTDALNRVMPEQMRAAMERNTPMKCLGEVEDIAAAALYLATPASRWVTGKIIEVDGGAESSVWPG